MKSVSKPCLQAYIPHVVDTDILLCVFKHGGTDTRAAMCPPAHVSASIQHLTFFPLDCVVLVSFCRTPPSSSAVRATTVCGSSGPATARARARSAPVEKSPARAAREKKADPPRAPSTPLGGKDLRSPSGQIEPPPPLLTSDASATQGNPRRRTTLHLRAAVVFSAKAWVSVEAAAGGRRLPCPRPCLPVRL